MNPPASAENEDGFSSGDDEAFVATLLEQSKTWDRIPDNEINPSHLKRGLLPAAHEPVFKMPRLDPPTVPLPPPQSGGRLRPRFPGPAGVIHRGRAGILVSEGNRRRNGKTCHRIYYLSSSNKL